MAYIKFTFNNIIEPEYLNISTIHGSKGTEFNYVFILELVKNILPSCHAQSEFEIEEERRTFYVAITRAIKKLYLIGNSFERPEQESIFLQDINIHENILIEKINNKQ